VLLRLLAPRPACKLLPSGWLRLVGGLEPEKSSASERGDRAIAPLTNYEMLSVDEKGFKKACDLVRMADTNIDEREFLEPPSGS
jgi:hypothetical protein